MSHWLGTVVKFCSYTKVVKTMRRAFGLSEPSWLTKLSHQTPHRLVSRGVLELYDLIGEARNRMVNQRDTRAWISFVFNKSRVFLLFYLLVSWTFQLFSAKFVRQRFICFPQELYAGDWRASAQNWSPHACPKFDRWVARADVFNHSPARPLVPSFVRSFARSWVFSFVYSWG